MTEPEEQPPGLARVLNVVPRALASKPHILFLVALGVFLVVLPLLGVQVSASAELIGGNYTNVTSDLGACIAAGGTLAVLHHTKKRVRLEEERHRLAQATHKLLTELHGGQQRGDDGDAAVPAEGRLPAA